MQNPRIVSNDLSAVSRFPDASVFGTGVKTQGIVDNGLRGTVKVETGSAGRAWTSFNINLDANQWYCFSFEVTQQDALIVEAGFKFSVNLPDLGDPRISGTDISNGGNKRYACIFANTTTVVSTFRLGVGIDSNQGGESMTYKDLMFEKIDINGGGFPSEYVFSEIPAAFNRSNYSVLGTNKVVNDSFGPGFAIDRDKVMLVVGDSRNDEIDDIGGAMSKALGDSGIAYVHGDGGWTTGDLIGPKSKNGFELTLEKALSGEILTRTFSTDGVEEMYRFVDGQVLPKIIVFANTGVNNIGNVTASALSIDVALAEMEQMVDLVLSKNLIPVLTELTPWNAGPGFSTGSQAQTFLFNARLAELARSKNLVFIKTYAAFGDSTDSDKLSDGAGSTPDYSQDGIHLNTAGSRLYASLVLSGIQSRNY